MLRIAALSQEGHKISANHCHVSEEHCVSLESSSLTTCKVFESKSWEWKRGNNKRSDLVVKLKMKGCQRLINRPWRHTSRKIWNQTQKKTAKRTRESHIKKSILWNRNEVTHYTITYKQQHKPQCRNEILSLLTDAQIWRPLALIEVAHEKRTKTPANFVTKWRP
jgi:hypothetical protein